MKLISFVLAGFFMLASLTPVFAETDINESENIKEVLTIEELEDLIVENSRGTKILEINDENIYRNQRIVNNAIKRVNANFGRPAMQASSLEKQVAGLAYSNEYKNLKTKEALGTLTAVEKVQLQNLEVQIAVLGKSAQDASAMVGSLSSTKKELNTQEERLEDAEEDILKASSDYVEEAKQIANLLALQVMEVEDTINLLENSYDLNLKLINIEKLKNNLGLSIVTDTEKQAVSTSDTGKQLNFLKEQRLILLQTINDLIGREINQPLSLVRHNVAESIFPAPSYESLIDEVIENSYDLYTLDRRIEDLEDEYDDTDGSHEEIIARNNIKLEKINKEQKFIDIQNELKSKLATYDSLAKTYQNAILSLRTAEKDYNFDKVKLDVGMISPLQFEASKLQYQMAVKDKVAAGYDYHLTRKELFLFKEGISLNNYNGIKARFGGPSGM